MQILDILFKVFIPFFFICNLRLILLLKFSQLPGIFLFFMF